MDTARAALESALSLAALHGERIAVAIADGSGRCLASGRGDDTDGTFEAEARSLAEAAAQGHADTSALHGTAVPENPIATGGTALLAGAGTGLAVAVRGTDPQIEQACAARAAELLDFARTSRLAPAELRRAMAAFVTGVIVAIARDPAAPGPVGFTATALVPLSLDPPLLGLSVGDTASSHPAFVRSTGFTVSVLHSGQSDLARRLARSGPEKFAGVDLVETAPGGWRLREASAVLSCRTRNTLRTGDHTLVIGEVDDARVLADKPALLFLGGGRFGHAEHHPEPAAAH